MANSSIEVKVVPINTPAKINIVADPNVADVVTVIPSPGKRGDAGPQGIQGIQGIQGQKGDKGDIGGVYTHNQSALSPTWYVAHNLGYNPNVTVVDSAGTHLEADLWYNNLNSLEIRFSIGVSGKAYLS